MTASHDFDESNVEEPTFGEQCNTLQSLWCSSLVPAALYQKVGIEGRVAAVACLSSELIERGDAIRCHCLEDVSPHP